MFGVTHQQPAQEHRLGQEGHPQLQQHAAEHAERRGRRAVRHLPSLLGVVQIVGRLLFPELVAPRRHDDLLLDPVLRLAAISSAIALLGEYIAKIFEEVKRRPHVHPPERHPRRRGPHAGGRPGRGRRRSSDGRASPADEHGRGSVRGLAAAPVQGRADHKGPPDRAGPALPRPPAGSIWADLAAAAVPRHDPRHRLRCPDLPESGRPRCHLLGHRLRRGLAGLRPHDVRHNLLRGRPLAH